MRTAGAGWWQPEVETGASVAEGDLLGTVSPIIGGTATRITAPAPGIPLFITSSPAVCADGLLLGADLAAAVRATVEQELGQRGSTGGVIAVGGDGRIVVAHNSPAMFSARGTGPEPTLTT